MDIEVFRNIWSTKEQTWWNFEFTTNIWL